MQYATEPLLTMTRDVSQKVRMRSSMAHCRQGVAESGRSQKAAGSVGAEACNLSKQGCAASTQALPAGANSKPGAWQPLPTCLRMTRR
jgi:hypothetical protein